MSKFPVGVAPITVPNVTADTYEGVTTVWIEGLTTVLGPASIEGRNAWVRLTANQAEVLLRELAAKLHIDVVHTDDEPVA